MLVLNSHQALGGTALSGEQQRREREREQTNTSARGGGICCRLVSLKIVGIMKTLLGLQSKCWSFPVVLADSSLHVQATSTHT